MCNFTGLVDAFLYGRQIVSQCSLAPHSQQWIFIYFTPAIPGPNQPSEGGQDYGSRNPIMFLISGNWSCGILDRDGWKHSHQIKELEQTPWTPWTNTRTYTRKFKIVLQGTVKIVSCEAYFQQFTSIPCLLMPLFIASQVRRRERAIHELRMAKNSQLRQVTLNCIAYTTKN